MRLEIGSSQNLIKINLNVTHLKNFNTARTDNGYFKTKGVKFVNRHKVNK